MAYTYDWYEEFFNKKVLPGLLREMKHCTGRRGRVEADFYLSLKESDSALYEEILFLEEKINDLWKMKGSKEVFRETCRAWSSKHFEAKPDYMRRLAEIPEQRALI